MYHMHYFGELTKLRVFGYRFMFLVLLDRMGRAWDDCIANTMILHLFDSDVLLDDYGYTTIFLWIDKDVWLMF